jgi:hypothetical protein
MNIHKNNIETALQVNKDNGPEVNTGTCITLNIQTLAPTWHNIYHHRTKPKSITIFNTAMYKPLEHVSHINKVTLWNTEANSC